MNIVVCNHKGGVSKTTTAFNLGAAMIERGHDVAFWDVNNSQGDLHYLCSRAGFRCFLPGHSSLSTQISTLGCSWNVVDTPPENDAAMRRALQVADVVLITVPARPLDVRGLGRITHNLQNSKPLNINRIEKVIVTMYTPNFRKEKMELLALPGFSFCKIVLPGNKVIVDAAAHGRSVLDYATATRAAAAYRTLAQEVEQWNQP